MEGSPAAAYMTMGKGDEVMREAVIIDAVRTPIGRYKGSLKDVRPDDLAAVAIKGMLARNPRVLPADIEEVVLGNANQAGEDNRNVARMASLLAGLPVETAGTTVNRLCGSGLDAVNYAARAILAGEGDIFIAGGTESMTRAPFVMAKPENEFQRGNRQLYDTTIGWRFTNPALMEMYGAESMPETAENVAKKFGLTRERQDLFSFESQMKAKAAMEEGRLTDEIIPVELINKGESKTFSIDEHPRPTTTFEKLSQLKPLFSGGTITAGNSSGINDGASVLLLMSAEKAAELGLSPLAKYSASAVAGVEPSIMGIGPVPAVRKAIERAGISIEEVDLIELNEAFAAQSIACIDQLGLDPTRVNVNGGAIAFGHPLGASGARILTSLVHEMKRRNSRYAMAAMCVGVGQGIAAILERWEE